MKAKNIIGIFIISAISSISAVMIYARYDKTHTVVQIPPSPQEQEAVLTSMPSALPADIDFTTSAEKSVHAVVHVKTESIQQEYYNPFYDFFFGQGYQGSPQPVMASGSGVIISSDGYIVTNNHVIEGAQKIEVTLNDKRTYEAQLVGTDPTTDIALLKIDESSLPYFNYGNSDALKVGEWVLAVGNPFNLTSTVTAGIVSAKARNINIFSKQFAIESFIQTDAAVNPGNSGGALVNNRGELVGINTAIASRTGSYVGYSFAVPVSIVKKVVSDIIEFGEVQRAYIGINIADLDADRAKELGLKDIKGVYVAGTIENGAADEAGIKKGDVLIYVGQKAVNSVAELQGEISKYRPGDVIDVTINRNNDLKHYKIELKNKNGETGIVQSAKGEILGVTLEKMDNNELRRFRIRNGVKITKVGKGLFYDAGVKEGFIITAINKQSIKDVDDAIQILNKAKGGVFIEGVNPNGSVAYYVFSKEE